MSGLLGFATDLIGYALLAWHAISPLGLVLGAGGLGLLLVAGLGLVALPGWLTKPAITAGAVLLGLGLVYEGGYAKATLAAEKRLALEIAFTNQERAKTAEHALAADRQRAAADAATIEAMRREIDATPRNPGACLPADAAGRVRRIR